MPIVRLDLVRRRALTRSGRVYELSGRPGMNSDALYVWGLWKRTNRVLDGRDVTLEVAVAGPAPPAAQNLPHDRQAPRGSLVSYGADQ